MKPWTALIVDDEALARSNLQLAMAEHAGWACAAVCASAAEARVVLAQRPVDLVLLDIQMPRQNGLSFASELCRMPQPPLIVFVTAHDEHALAAFDVFALDYLLKPFDDQRFAQTLQRAEQLLTLKQRDNYAAAVDGFLHEQHSLQAGQALPMLPSLTVRSVGLVERIALADIDWVLAAGNYVELHIGSRTVLHRSTLAALEARLPPTQFMRVHRTAMVRRDQAAALAVTGDSSYQLSLRSGAQVPVSERYVRSVRALFDEPSRQ
ncbi:LytTR family DNA-binding domain-containing protein [Paucibacter sp. APW11]|uniref:LytTR family DNA-binding domain-containing protein n=1 Tax=Roseateles aquae TaxID=3077235 RepID=A0ABU3PF62_9BURK|nr:LytTR family DNA-binding domain-containing protein [Paucibacter sp. APW11]MDT9000748.1 LytTR family DNA-binding domain-containing protein [Paucibacter sp. APW11]